jgi:hypothetical protein
MTEAENLVRRAHASGCRFFDVWTQDDSRVVVDHLMRCHGHVFIVDQSKASGREGLVTIWMSENGVNCLVDAGYLPADCRVMPPYYIPRKVN